MSSVSRSLAGKTIVVGVTGSIAAFKAPHIVSRLTSLGANVVVAMTESATRFVAPLTFETLSGNEVVVDMFPEKKVGMRSADEAAASSESLRHVALAERASLVLVAPATANIIGKMAHGVADDFLSTELMAMKCPVVVAPAMNVNMMESDAVTENIETLRRRGVTIVDAETGRLASGAVGKGRLADPDHIVDVVLGILLPAQDLAGRTVLVTAGPTHEPIDPVRHLANRSTGRMGYAVAERALLRGAQVVLISGPGCLEPPPVHRFIRVVSSSEMSRIVLDEFEGADLLVMAAAVADYRPAEFSENKIKKKPGSLTLTLERTEDILSEVKARKRPGQGVVGFAVETEREIEEGKRKLSEKDLDLIVVNNPKTPGAAFGHDTNVATIITRSGRTEELELMPKTDLADIILTRTITELGWSSEPAR